MPRRRVVIIGGGAAGAFMLRHLLRRGHDAVDIIEPRARVGRGLAYSTASDRHLINVPAHKMDMFAETGDPLFTSWLAGRAPQFTPDDYPPRCLYGDFLEEIVAAQSARADIRHIRTSASSIRETPEGLRVVLAGGGELPAALAILALGNLTPALLSPGRTDSRIIEDPWSVPPEAMASARHVVIAGTGLTALDAVVAIADANPHSRFTLAAAHPLVPPCDLSVAAWSEGETVIGRPPAIAWNLAKSAIRRQPDPLGWYEIVDGLRPHVEQI